MVSCFLCHVITMYLWKVKLCLYLSAQMNDFCSEIWANKRADSIFTRAFTHLLYNVYLCIDTWIIAKTVLVAAIA